MRNKYDTHYVRADEINRDWVIVDVASLNLGRAASKIAALLRGKNKVLFQPSVDVGDNVIVINASKINVSGNKLKNKIYFWYTGFPGGIKEKNFEKMLADDPDRVMRLAIKRMLPKGRIGRAMLTKLHIYAGPTHKNEAQKPKQINL
ncbi:MAG: 50S ribosomal protein L13 [Candidatus Margulisbacteria bacterium GWF2_35_9]|nr:MAG: 50S ribosomal protein L13 [Candidatus Margulisbacteria bacterium GWF2_35_9]